MFRKFAQKRMKETLYNHYKNKNLYRVLHPCKYQHNGEWFEAVCYQDVETLEVYVRESDSFEECFSAE
jgi:hypothetical protein